MVSGTVQMGIGGRAQVSRIATFDDGFDAINGISRERLARGIAVDERGGWD